jgi:tRNA A37 threonylcarbamoyladenosine dehydratase
VILQAPHIQISNISIRSDTKKHKISKQLGQHLRSNISACIMTRSRTATTVAERIDIVYSAEETDYKAESGEKSAPDRNLPLSEKQSTTKANQIQCDKITSPQVIPRAWKYPRIIFN